MRRVGNPVITSPEAPETAAKSKRIYSIPFRLVRIHVVFCTPVRSKCHPVVVVKLGYYRGYIGIMEKKMETAIVGLYRV